MAGVIGATQKREKKEKTLLRSASGAEFSEKTLENAHRISWGEFSDKGIFLHSEVTPELGMHALLRIMGHNDTVLGQGVVCLVDVIRRRAQQDRASTNSTASAASEPGQGTKIDLSVGGQYRGEISVDVKCEELTRCRKKQLPAAPSGSGSGSAEVDLEEGAADADVARREDRTSSANKV